MDICDDWVDEWTLTNTGKVKEDIFKTKKSQPDQSPRHQFDIFGPFNPTPPSVHSTVICFLIYNRRALRVGFPTGNGQSFPTRSARLLGGRTALAQVWPILSHPVPLITRWISPIMRLTASACGLSPGWGSDWKTWLLTAHRVDEAGKSLK